MAALPGKSCGSCTMCCVVLEIDHFEKPPGKVCDNCKLGGGCKIYKKRPEVCRDYECNWITDRDLGPMLKPDRIGTILMDDPDSDDYLAVCDPAKPNAWRNPLVFRHLLAVAKEGRTVIAKAGTNSWRIFESGQTAPWV